MADVKIEVNDETIEDFTQQLAKLRESPVIVIDTETTGKAPPPLFPAHPAHPENRIVTIGLASVDEPHSHVETHYLGKDLTVDQYRKELRDFLVANVPVGFWILAGHNVRFDWGYLAAIFREYNITEPSAFFDTQNLAYLESCQRMISPSLVEVHTAYCPTLPHDKDEAFYKMLESGCDIYDMDADYVLNHVKNDVNMTRDALIEILKRMDTQSEARKTLMYVLACFDRQTAQMQAAGIEFDLRAAEQLRVDLTKENAKLFDLANGALNTITQYVNPSYLEIPKTYRAIKPAVMSALAWGGAYHYEVTQQVGFYKSGKRKGEPKFQSELETVTLDPPLETQHIKARLEINKNDLFPTGSDVIEDAIAELVSSKTSSLSILRGRALEWMLTYKKNQKIISTYLDDMIDNRPDMDYPCIYPKYNHSVTATGRISSSEPNGQNMPPIITDILRPMGADEIYLTADIKQLEIIGLHTLSRCPVLGTDLLLGKDVHFETGKAVFKWEDESEMSKEDRRTVKGINFGLIYGGKEKTLSEQSRAPYTLVRSIIKSFYARYYGVAKYHKGVIERAESGAVIVPGNYHLGGYQVHEYELELPTGRKYKFNDELTPPHVYKYTKVPTTFSPTKLKNYPVQGLSTGDIVPLYVLLVGWLVYGVELEAAWQEYVPFPVTTIHDSLTYQLHETDEPMMKAVYEAAAILTNLIANKLWPDLHLDVPLVVEVDKRQGIVIK